MILEIRKNLESLISYNKDDAKRFFKTSPGSYGYHDEFIGVSVPNLRKLSKTYKSINLNQVGELLSSKINEERLLALFILIDQYQNASSEFKEIYYDFYLKNINQVNNWNLVDASAHLILGAHLFDKDRSIIDNFSFSPNIWIRRISIISTWYFIKKLDLDYTFEISNNLLNDKEDLIHKATGWMLREAGKKDYSKLISFLEKHKSKMPRTMLRYSIEKLSEEERKYFLQKNL